MARRRRKTRTGRWVGRLLTAVLAVPAVYLVAALIGSLVPVNGGWQEPAEGTTVYIADNGIHADIIMPVRAEGLDWAPLVPKSDFAAADPERPMDRLRLGRGAGLSGHSDLVGHDAADDLVGAGRRQARDARRICRQAPLMPNARSASGPKSTGGCGRRSVPISTLDARGRPKRVAHPGYGCCDAFYRTAGKASIVHTCNSWVADRLRLAGVKTSLWPPFISGLVWRYRKDASEHVAAEVGVPGDARQLLLDESRIDDERLAAAVFRVEAHVLEQFLHHRLQPPRADVLERFVDLGGDAGERRDAVVGEGDGDALGAEQRLVLLGQAGAGLR